MIKLTPIKLPYFPHTAEAEVQTGFRDRFCHNDWPSAALLVLFSSLSEWVYLRSSHISLHKQHYSGKHFNDTVFAVIRTREAFRLDPSQGTALSLMLLRADRQDTGGSVFLSQLWSSSSVGAVVTVRLQRLEDESCCLSGSLRNKGDNKGRGNQPAESERRNNEGDLTTPGELRNHLPHGSRFWGCCSSLLGYFGGFLYSHLRLCSECQGLSNRC